MRSPTVTDVVLGAVPAREAADARLGYRRLAAINAFWLGNGAHWQPIFVSLLPLGARLVDTAHKELIVGRATAAGGVFALLVPVIVGWLSDRTISRWGRRRPWMVGGAVVNALGLVLLGLAWTPILVISCYLLVQASNNVAGAAYNGVIPDVVPVAERGRASGLLGTMNSVGTVLGLLAVVVILFVAGSNRLGLLISYLALGSILLATLVVTCVGTPERASTRLVARGGVSLSPAVGVFAVCALVCVSAVVGVLLVPELTAQGVAIAVIAAGGAIVSGRRVATIRAFLRPFADNDFRWTFLTRSFVQLGIFSIIPFVDFYFSDVMHSSSPDLQSSIWLLFVLGGGVVPSVVGGALSDRWQRRKIFVYTAGGIQAAVVSVLLFGLITSLPVMYVLGITYGVGYGIYYSVDWALACDVLPGGEAEAGKEMGLWHVAFTFPQVLAPAILAPVLYHLNRGGASIAGVPTGNNLGYRVIFGSATLWFLLGTWMVSRIRKVR